MEPAADPLRVLTTNVPRRAVALVVACVQVGVDRGARRAQSGEEPG